MQMTRKRGNPDWSSGRPVKVRASAPTEFEMQAQRLGLTEDNYESSEHLRRWCEDNRHRFYMPEWLLRDGACPSIRMRRKRLVRRSQLASGTEVHRTPHSNPRARFRELRLRGHHFDPIRPGRFDAALASGSA